MANSELNFSVRLQMLTDQFNQGLRESRSAFEAATQSIIGNTNDLRTNSTRAEQALTTLFNAPSNDLTTTIQNTTAQLNGLVRGANISEEQLQQAFTTAANHVQNLSNDLDAARARLQNMTLAGASLTSIQQAQTEIAQLEQRLTQAQTASTEFGNAMSSALNRAGQTAQQTEASIDRLLGVRSNNAITSDINAISQALDHLQTEFEQGRISQQEFNRLSQAGQVRLNALQGELNSVSTATQRTTTATDGLGNVYGKLQGILATLGLGFSVVELVRVSDTYTALAGRIKLASDSQEEYKSAMAGVLQVTQETYQPLKNTAELYYKVSDATKAMGLTQSQVLGVTRTINQAVLLSGSSAESAAAAVMQFNQSLASGVFRGEEFNSVAEQAPYLLTVMSEALGVTNGELRKMAGEGQLTAQVVIKALQDQEEAVNRAFKNAPVTIGNAVQNVKNSFTVLIGEMNNTTDASNDIIAALQFVSQNMNELAAAFVTAAKVAIAYKAVNLAITLYEKAQAANAAALAMRNEAAAVAQNTSALAANSAQASANAAAQSRVGASAAASAAQVNAANLSIVSGLNGMRAGVASAQAGVLGLTSKLGMLGAALAVGYVGFDLLKDAGKLLGDGMGYVVTQLDGTAAAIKKADNEAKSRAANLEVQSATEKRIQEAIKKGHDDIAYKASESSKSVIKSFDAVISKGGDVKKALDEITLNTSKPVDIQKSINALNDLRNLGKITAEEMQSKIQDSLNGIDLTVFNVNMQTGIAGVAGRLDEAKFKVAELEVAFLAAGGAGTEAGNKINAKLIEQRKEVAELEKAHRQGVEQMAIAQDAILGESIKRTGLDIEVLKGQMTKQSQSAINDVSIIAENFDLLKERGIDASLTLASSLGSAIKDADNPKALQVLQGQITDLSDRLGKEYTQGLMIDLKNRVIEVNNELDKTKPGINSITEAFHEFGFKTKEEFAVVAEQSRASFDVMQKSGQATTAQLQAAWQKWAESAIAANGGVSTAAIDAEARQLGLAKRIDETGKISWESAKKIEQGTDNVTESINRAASSASNIGNTIESSANRGVNALNTLNRKLSETDAWNKRVAESSALEKAQRQANDNNWLTSVSNDYSQLSTLTGIENFLKSAGLEQAQAMREAQKLMDQYGKDGMMNWALANGLRPGQATTSQDIANYQSPSEYLLSLAERERYRNLPQSAPTPVVNNQTSTGGGNININLRINGELATPLSNGDFEIMASKLVQRLQDDAKRQAV